MLLQEVLGAQAAHAPPVEVTALAYDHRKVGPGTLFFCVPGFTRDGHEFAPAAAAAGAVALVVERAVDTGGVSIPQIRVASVREAMAPAAAAFHGDPTAHMKMVGITGTNGKTTSAFLVRDVLVAAGLKTGMLGTIRSVVGGEEQTAVRTTPEAIDLQATFAAMLAAGDEACVMEVSSHAMALHRADAIHWDVAIFTNLSQDHLDFHRDMADYFAAKRRLFVAAAAGGATLIANVDDQHAALLAREFPGLITVGIDAPADVQALDIVSTAGGSKFTVDGDALTIPLPGRFNVLNALGAVAAARALGVAEDVICAALPQALQVPGRFQAVDEGQGFAVLVDYAHTPDSLDNVLQAARTLTSGRVLCVFGAGGDRDRGKRPQMGEIAARMADHVVITSDNPRSEDPLEIIGTIVGGVQQATRHAVEVIPDRAAAITRVVELAADGDVVVVAGKGHEQGQEFADGLILPFDDVGVAREALRARLDA